MNADGDLANAKGRAPEGTRPVREPVDQTP
jgi:hypothetical protein